MQRSVRLSALTATAFLLTSAFTGAVSAAPGPRDSDRDGIPDRWERTHGLNPHRAADARQDLDGDRLTNLREYRVKSRIRDEDTDDDGHDDGDEVTDGRRSTDVRDRDTDDDGTPDGDEDSDHDGVDNEDEDDATETCVRDDDDRDEDAVDDEDENDFGSSPTDDDSDDDGTADGDEDSDSDGEANEDADDSASDRCEDEDSDDDGEADEDESDVLGTISFFDPETGLLNVVADAAYEISGVVTEDTEISFEDGGDDAGEGPETRGGGDPDGTIEDLAVGVRVADIEIDHEDGLDLVEEIEIYTAVDPCGGARGARC